MTDLSAVNYRIARTREDIVQWAIAVVTRPNSDHEAHDAGLRRSVYDYQMALEDRRSACGHRDAIPVSSPMPGKTERWCKECDTRFLTDSTT